MSHNLGNMDFSTSDSNVGSKVYNMYFSKLIFIYLFMSAETDALLHNRITQQLKTYCLLILRTVRQLVVSDTEITS